MMLSDDTFLSLWDGASSYIEPLSGSADLSEVSTREERS